MKKMVLDYSKIKPLSEASHDKGINGRKAKPPNNPSEWAWTMAASRFPRGAKISINELRTALIEALAYEVISKMIDDDEAYLCLDESNEVIIVPHE